MEPKPSYTLGYIVLVLCFFGIVYQINSCSSSDDSYAEKSTDYTICECETAYRALMYGEGSHAENKYTGEKYNTLDANGNAYIDVIDKCAILYANGGKPLNEGGFSKYQPIRIVLSRVMSHPIRLHLTNG